MFEGLIRQIISFCDGQGYDLTPIEALNEASTSEWQLKLVKIYKHIYALDCLEAKKESKGNLDK